MSREKVRAIHAGYVDGRLDFESARDGLHALDPSAMREVLSLAIERDTPGRDLLVMVLADVQYPPALPHLRAWIDDDDLEGIALPAASGLDLVAGKRFRVGRFWSGDQGELPATLDALAAWWDAGVAVASEQEWLAAQRAKRRKDRGDVPPPSPALTAAEQQTLYDDLVALAQELARLPAAVQHRLDVAAIARVLPIYRAHAPDDAVLDAAVAALARALDGDAAARASLARHAELARAATERASAAAGWSKAHGRYRAPDARAAAHVAQGVVYACSEEVRNRLQAMHSARSALEYAGHGFAAVRAELDWQLAQVRAARATSTTG